MRKQLLIFAIVFVSLLAFTFWRAQLPFRLQRKLLAKLPYVPDTLLVTDLDDDGHPEVMAVRSDKPPVWVRFPFDKLSLLRFENCRAIWIVYCRSVLKALPVLKADNRLRLLRWKDKKAKLAPLPSLPDVPMDGAEVLGRKHEDGFLARLPRQQLLVVRSDATRALAVCVLVYKSDNQITGAFRKRLLNFGLRAT